MTFKITVSYKGSYPDNTNMYGQNISIKHIDSSEQDQFELLFPKVKDHWYKEVNFYQRSSSNFTHNCNDGQYTHKVWADSHVK